MGSLYPTPPSDPRPGRNIYELQADCLAGAYTLDAEEEGLLEPGDFIEALQMSEAAGDPIWFPQDAPGAHGTYADRSRSVMRGYLDGVAGCNLFQQRHTPTPSPVPTPTLIPTPTPTLTFDPTPTSTRVVEGKDPRFPELLPLGHASCFRIESNSVLTFDDLAGRLGGTEEARQRLVDWGWSTSANRTFACDAPPDGEAGWIDISLHRFESATAAQQAVDFFAAVRAEGTSLSTADPPVIGDYATALTGPTSNGKEFTLYASQGPVLLRVTGVSPTGIPFANVLTVARAVLTLQLTESQSTLVPTAPPSAVSVPASAYLPAYPAVNYAECFHVYDSGSYNYDEVVEAFESTGLSRTQIDDLGWQDGAYVVFSCADPPVGRASQLDVVIHQFSNSRGALPYFAQTYAPGVNETRACNNADTLVVCVTGRSLTGSPLTDVHFVLNQVLAAAR